MAPPKRSVEHREEHLRAKDKTRLYWQAWRPAGDPRAALIIVHGLKDHGSRYAREAEEFAERGYAVYAADLRGHGRSGGPPVFVRSFDEYLSDLDLVLDLVRGAEPGRPVFLLGHSLGGAIAALFVQTRRPDLRGLVLSAAALKPGPSVSPALVQVTKALGRALPKLNVLKTKNSDFSRDPAVVEAMDNDPLIHQKVGPARTSAELLKAMGRIREGADRMDAPMLLLHGSADPLASPDGSRELHRTAHSGDKTLKIYDGLYHDLLHEPERDQVMRDVLGWLDERVPLG